MQGNSMQHSLLTVSDTVVDHERDMNTAKRGQFPSKSTLVLPIVILCGSDKSPQSFNVCHRVAHADQHTWSPFTTSGQPFCSLPWDLKSVVMESGRRSEN